MIYVYGITRASAGPPDCRGLGDQPLGLLELGELGAICSPHEGREAFEGVEALWRHDRVLELAIQRAPALPVRFGTTFANRREALAALGPRAGSFQRQLRRLGGCVELAVRLEVTSQDAQSAPDGRSYLEAKLSRRRVLSLAADRALPALEELALDSCRLQTTTDAACVKASYLVRRDDVEGFVEAVRSVAPPDDTVRLSCTGPWAPYSFVNTEPA